ncbi:hypothetical protein SETIT_2G086100v2 [Setaria italica]|uniref:Uncharacterized protein n=1 Tax=Setaria italica TaxID=4555 RepID=A0A368PX63_SETIT|nr:hypothetical protein SETIT_2G086100v2 [Setaria italica]
MRRIDERLLQNIPKVISCGHPGGRELTPGAFAKLYPPSRREENCNFMVDFTTSARFQPSPTRLISPCCLGSILLEPGLFCLSCLIPLVGDGQVWALASGARHGGTKKYKMGGMGISSFRCVIKN